MTQFVKTPVFNAITGASQVSLSAGVLFISGADSSGDSFDPMVYTGITGIDGGLKKSLEENAYVASITFSAANDTTYSLLLSQEVDGNTISKAFTVISDATATAAEIAAAFVTAINGDSQYRVTAAGSGSPFTITGDAGYPLFTVTASQNMTVANGMATYAPNVTASAAITAVIAPDGTAATAIAGTTTVTVTTLAAHLLVPGDIVTIASVATMTLQYQDANGKILTGQAGGTFRVATVPTSTTFTLEGVVASGTNSGTITITAVNCCFVQTAAAQTSIDTGDQLVIAGVATATLNGTTGGTFRVGAVLSGDQRFKLESAALVGTNSGTITITLAASASRGDGAALDAAGILGITTTDNYSSVEFSYVDGTTSSPDFGVQPRGLAKVQTAYFNESDTDIDAFVYALDKALGGVLFYTPVIADPDAYSKA